MFQRRIYTLRKDPILEKGGKSVSRPVPEPVKTVVKERFALCNKKTGEVLATILIDSENEKSIGPYDKIPIGNRDIKTGCFYDPKEGKFINGPFNLFVRKIHERFNKKS